MHMSRTGWSLTMLLVAICLLGVACTTKTPTAAGEQRVAVTGGGSPNQFLTLPFKQGTPIEITEGWIYSDAENEIHGKTNHYAIDFAAPRGTKVYAPCDGLAVQGYHLRYLPGREHEGKKVGFCLGHFVQIWHPETKKFISLAHLEWVSSKIPEVEKETLGDGWDPIGIYKTPDEIKGESAQVERGQLIGHVGDSGLAWGYQETPELRPDPEQNPSWDETHVELQVYIRGADGQKLEWFDPYAIKGQAGKYQDIKAMPRGAMWLLDEKGMPRCAVE